MQYTVCSVWGVAQAIGTCQSSSICRAARSERVTCTSFSCSSARRRCSMASIVSADGATSVYACRICRDQVLSSACSHRDSCEEKGRSECRYHTG